MTQHIENITSSFCTDWIHRVISMIAFILVLTAPSNALSDDAAEQASGTTGQVRQELFTTVEDVKQIIDRKSPVNLIDIRSQDDFAQAHIPGSLNIPIHFIRTKAFLKNNPVVIVSEGYQYAHLEPECKRLAEEGFKVLILLGGLNSWKQSSLPLEGESSMSTAFDRISPEAFHLEKDFDHWVILDASKKKAKKESMPSAVPFDPDSLFATSRLKGSVKDKREGKQGLVLIANDTGTEYQNIARLVSQAELKNVFYLEGGIEAYEQYLKGVALAKEPREKRVQKIQKCPTCGG